MSLCTDRDGSRAINRIRFNTAEELEKQEEKERDIKNQKNSIKCVTKNENLKMKTIKIIIEEVVQ
jgi:hypothetical protein